MTLNARHKWRLMMSELQCWRCKHFEVDPETCWYDCGKGLECFGSPEKCDHYETEAGTDYGVLEEGC